MSHFAAGMFLLHVLYCIPMSAVDRLVLCNMAVDRELRLSTERYRQIALLFVLIADVAVVAVESHFCIKGVTDWLD